MTDDDGTTEYKAGVTAPERPSRAHTARLVLGGVLLAVVIAIVIDNRQNTKFSYVFGDVRAPLIVVLLIAAVLGAAIGWLLLHRPHRQH